MLDGIAAGDGHVFGMTFGTFVLDMFVIFLLVTWFWLLIRVFSDLFRRDDATGLGRVMWVIFLVLIPYIGIFAYLLTQGWGMTAREQEQSALARVSLRAGPAFSVADEIAKLDALRAKGSLTEAEHLKLRGRLLG